MSKAATRRNAHHDRGIGEGSHAGLALTSADGRLRLVPEESQRAIPESIHVDDVDDAIGLAAEKARADQDTLSVAQLVEIGAEVGLPASAMVQAAAELADHKRAIAEREVLRNRYILGAVTAIGSSIVLCLVAAAVGRSSLVEQRTVVEAKRAQVVSVVKRRNDLLANIEGAGLASEERWAEVSGSENRIAVEKRRYDEAATEYNRRAASFSGSLGAALFDHPKHMELSSEIVSW